MTSTESSPEANQAEAADHEALRDALETGEGVKRLLRMSAVKSIHRNLKMEDEWIRRGIEQEQRMGMDNPAEQESEPMPTEDPMDIMAARDVIVYQGGSDRWPPSDPRGTQPTAPSAPQPAVAQPPRVEQPRSPVVQPARPKPVAVAPTPPAEASKYPAWLGPALLGAGLLGGVGLGSYLGQPSTPAEYVDTDTDTQAVGGFEIFRPEGAK